MYLSDDPEEQKRIFLKKGLSKEADRIATQQGLTVKKWCFPLGFVKRKPNVNRKLSFWFFWESSPSSTQDGLYFLQLMKWAVLQYCVIRPTLVCHWLVSLTLHWQEALRTTLAAVILDLVGFYCESSWNPRWGHVYVRTALAYFLLRLILLPKDHHYHFCLCDNCDVLSDTTLHRGGSRTSSSQAAAEAFFDQGRW